MTEDHTRRILEQIASARPGRFNAAQTLLRAPRALSAADVDIALFGMPFDMGTFGRDGSRLGPDHIRQQSHNIRSKNYLTGINPGALCSFGDIGDAPIDVFDPGRSVDLVSDYCRAVCGAGAAPVAVGGDHTIPLFMLRGLATRHGPVAVIHFDAHPDTYDTVAGSKINHGTPFRRAVEEGLEIPHRHVMIGLRGTLDEEDQEAFDWARDQGMAMIDMDECEALGPAGVAQRCRQVIGDMPAYITIDADGVDPGDMPGTGSPEPGGLRMREMQAILRGLRGMNIVGADICEVSPPLDPTGVTAFNAAHLLFEMLCLVAESIANQRT